jgi:hypothetical protein
MRAPRRSLDDITADINRYQPGYGRRSDLLPKIKHVIWWLRETSAATSPVPYTAGMKRAAKKVDKAAARLQAALLEFSKHAPYLSRCRTIPAIIVARYVKRQSASGTLEEIRRNFGWLARLHTSNPSRGRTQELCAEAAFYLIEAGLDRRKSSQIASLLYEAVTGTPTVDLRRALRRVRKRDAYFKTEKQRPA